MKKLIVLLIGFLPLIAFGQIEDVVNVGTAPDANDGDSLRRAFQKVNAEFAVYEADSSNWLHWADTLTKISTSYDISLKLNSADALEVDNVSIKKTLTVAYVDTAYIYTQYDAIVGLALKINKADSSGTSPGSYVTGYDFITGLALKAPQTAVDTLPGDNELTNKLSLKADQTAVDTLPGDNELTNKLALKADKTAVDTLPGDNELTNKLALKLNKADSTADAPDNYASHTALTTGLAGKATPQQISDSLINVYILKNSELVDLVGQDFTPPHIYYVSNAGDDANSGTSPSQSWAHHPWMSTWTGAVTLKPGDIVCMKRGDTWTISDPAAPYMTVAQSGVQDSMIYTTAYGLGDKPLIKVATATNQQVLYADAKSFLVFDNLHLQHHSSTYNSSGTRSAFYFDGATNPCHDITLTNNEIDNVPHFCIVGGTNCYNMIVGDTLVTSVATTTKYSNNMHDFGYVGVELHGSNPATKISNQHIFGNYIHDARRTTPGDNEYGISITANASSASWPQLIDVRYNRVEDLRTWVGIDTHGADSMYVIDNYVKNCLYGIDAGGTTLGDLPDKAKYVFVERNTIELDTLLSAGLGIASNNTSTTTPSSYIYIKDNTIFYTHRPLNANITGITLGNIINSEVSGNYLYNGPKTETNVIGIYLKNYGLDTINNLTIKENFIINWPYPMKFVNASVNGTVNIYNNIFIAYQCNVIRGSGTIPATATLNLYNNVLLSTNAQAIFYFPTTADILGTLNAKNNILGWTSSQDSYYWYFNTTPGGTLNIDYNIYWNNSDANCMYYNASARSWSYWTSTLSKDGNSPNSDEDLNPLFKNIGGSYLLESDFDLQTTSPAINEGVDVAIDYLGAAPDIGYIEKR